MFGRFAQQHTPPPLDDFPLKSYTVAFSLDRLMPGVDNIRHDVLISPIFTNATRKIAAQLVARHAGIEKRGPESPQSNWIKEVDGYKQLFREVMGDALNKAKARRDPQIECLAQAAVVKMLLGEIRFQFDHLVGMLKKSSRQSDLVTHNDWSESPKQKHRLQLLLQDREIIIQRVGLEICGFWAEVERNALQTMREAIFGRRAPFFADVIGTAILHALNPDNDFFTLAEYDLALGRRIEDPDRYETLLFFIRHLFSQLDRQGRADDGPVVEQRAANTPADPSGPEIERQKAYMRRIDGWLCHLGNVDLLLNRERTRSEYQALRKQKASAEAIDRAKRMMQRQQQALAFFYGAFRSKGLINRIAASYEMQPEYLTYCPPLSPQQVIQYLISPRARRQVKSRLKRMVNIYGRTFPLAPLDRKLKSMEYITTAKRKRHLVRFLNAFTRYHRDASNCDIIKEAMERVHIAADEKVVTLSRENNTLYEFLLPHEQAATKAPIINHVVIKADVRGSTDITSHMNERGLNPASHFALNFFDPISEILSEYDATKVFIEGDAVILSIFERENAPSDWYAVARACGIAINMLIIIQRYNEKNRKNQLPVLELGVGISYLDKTPTFLFDGSHRIMISPAINQADRLSSCSKMGRRMFTDKKSPFRLRVFQTLSDEEMAATTDDLFVRYNVNGIELSAAGFEKLGREIDLKLLPAGFGEMPDHKSSLYAGKFPTKSGRYQRLIVRESQIPVVDPATMQIVRITSRKYYEVCTHPGLYKWVRQAAT
ncbi:hypothetical protein [Desulfatitalea alkaliphila]|uniref:Guanylate cyclase domain-containing protein n=1 Tax=Desulfatitalea alkaliphila TaxID=2929485 RepID=A0AA41R0W7_9BACT|nr:hypothetical protein [Desulfatitalea alkaliphila]MCJ8499878.1 hypothetical protein [Desulfatitalea alkaliphila]